MIQTILITGSSSGIGLATAIYFAEKGWRVAATMRTPKELEQFKKYPNIKVYQLDVTTKETISTAIKSVITDFGGIDVIVNNAGYGAVGIFEKATPEQIEKEFQTNVFGAMNVIREILPHFRQKKSGTIINITSMGGLLTFPLYSVYHATKWAMEGFAESLALELKPLNIRVKNIEPGAIKTSFYDRSMDLFKNSQITDYDNYEKVTFSNMQFAGATAPGPEIVAKKIYQAANQKNWKLRYPVGGQGLLLLWLRKVLPFSLFNYLISKTLERGFKKLL